MDGKSRITRAAGLISLATFISRVLGYVKDMILARYFGATGLSDTFFVAFRIPNLLRELFAEGSMSSAFVPVLTGCQTREGREEADRLVRIVGTLILIFDDFEEDQWYNIAEQLAKALPEGQWVEIGPTRSSTRSSTSRTSTYRTRSCA